MHVGNVDTNDVYISYALPIRLYRWRMVIYSHNLLGCGMWCENIPPIFQVPWHNPVDIGICIFHMAQLSADLL